jgi:hypothetical protein
MRAWSLSIVFWSFGEISFDGAAAGGCCVLIAVVVGGKAEKTQGVKVESCPSEDPSTYAQWKRLLAG